MSHFSDARSPQQSSPALSDRAGAKTARASTYDPTQRRHDLGARAIGILSAFAKSGAWPTRNDSVTVGRIRELVEEWDATFDSPLDCYAVDPANVTCAGCIATIRVPA